MGKKTVKTIEDIARLANVSKSTVSRALNDSPLIKTGDPPAHPGDCHRAALLPVNTSARCLSNQESCTIAFVTHAYHLESFSVEDLFGLEIMGGISSGLYKLGYEHADDPRGPQRTGLGAPVPGQRQGGWLHPDDGQLQAEPHQGPGGDGRAFHRLGHPGAQCQLLLGHRR